MKRVCTYCLALMLLAGVIAGSILLPPALSGYLDAQRMGKLFIEEQEDVPVQQPDTVSTAQKFALLDGNLAAGGQDMLPITVLYLEGGAHFDAQTIGNQGIGEILTLRESGFFPTFDTEGDWQVTHTQSRMYIRTDDPSQCVIEWMVGYSSEQGYVLLSIDDESGKIMRYIELTRQPIMQETVEDAFIAKWAGYWGLAVTDFAWEQLLGLIIPPVNPAYIPRALCNILLRDGQGQPVACQIMASASMRVIGVFNWDMLEHDLADDMVSEIIDQAPTPVKAG
nr:hypothetical protein [bacterium]